MGDYVFSRMTVYREAMDLAEECDRIAAELRGQRWQAGNQLCRASLSVVLNIAEGTGELRPLEKARFYRMARRSMFETGACLEYLERIGCLPASRAARLIDRTQKVSAGLSLLTKTMYRRSGELRNERAETRSNPSP